MRPLRAPAFQLLASLQEVTCPAARMAPAAYLLAELQDRLDGLETAAPRPFAAGVCVRFRRSICAVQASKSLLMGRLQSCYKSVHCLSDGCLCFPVYTAEKVIRVSNMQLHCIQPRN